MSGQAPAPVNYAVRKKRSQHGSMPQPPPDEDVAATTAFERAQAFASPPPPPLDAPPVQMDASSAKATSRGTPQSSLKNDITSSTTQAKSDETQTSLSASSGAKKSSAHLHPYINSLPTNDSHIPTTLTPLRAHYLKKTLVNLQMAYELNLITDPVLGANALGLLGDPFTLSESAKRDALARISEVSRMEGRLGGDLPFLRFLFHQFLLPFPFLQSAPPTFWSNKVQPFLSSFLATTGATAHATMSDAEKSASEALMTKEERKEVEERNKLWSKVEKHASLMVGVGVKIVGGEEVVRIGQADLRRLEEQQEQRRQRWNEQRARSAAMGGGVFEVNVVGVRVVTEKGRVRSKSHDEFLVRTKRAGVQDVYVSRRYGDFKRLSDELRMAFPDFPLPPPPPKDKSVAVAPTPPPTQYSYYNPLRVIYGSGSSPNPSGTSTPNPSGSSPTLNSGNLGVAGGDNVPTTPLSREKNRMTLRAYLQTILAIPFILNSPILRSFLLSNPTVLTPAEAADSQRRLEADAVREEGRRRFKEEAEKRIEALREGLTMFKGDVLAKEGGLQKVFEVVRRVERVEDLPRAEASVLEWGRISLAATIFQLFVASDTASDTLTSLKRIHGLMPYFVLKGVLRISNPMAMIRGVLDLFLARPFGGQSLIQRMFSANLNDDVRLISEDILVMQEKIDDPVLCQKIEQYAMAPFEIQEVYRKDAVAEQTELLTVILRSPDPPSLNKPQFQKVVRASRAYKAYKVAQGELDDSDDDLGPEDEEAWLFEDLNILLRLWLRRREKELLVALIFEGVTAELLKDIITIFYAPLAQVYKAASIADSLGDLQNFLNDMIRTVEQVEELSQEDPGRTVQTFIDLVQRHEQAFYTFVHNVHSKGQGLFDSLMCWIELFLGYARDGLAQPVDLDFILPAGGAPREQVMKEVDAVAQYHYRLKVAHEEKIRRRFRREAAGEEEAALLDSVMASLSLGDSAMAEGGEMGDEESEEEDEEQDDEDEFGEDAVSGERRGSGEPGAIRARGPTEWKEEDDPAATVPENNDNLQPPSVDKGSTWADNLTSAQGSASARTSLDTRRISIDRDRSRRGSNASTGSGTGGPRVSVDKIRSALKHEHKPREDDGGSAIEEKKVKIHSRKGDKEKVKEDKEKKLPPPPVVVMGPAAAAGDRRSPRPPRKRDKRVLEMMEHPKTDAIAELRPLFVEMIRPQLVVKALNPVQIPPRYPA